MNTSRSRAAAGIVAALAALTLCVAAPAAADAKIHGGAQSGIVHVALVAPGHPPLPCTPGRYKCPLGGGLL